MAKYKTPEYLISMPLETLSADMQENINLIITLSDNFETDDTDAHELDDLMQNEFEKIKPVEQPKETAFKPMEEMTVEDMQLALKEKFESEKTVPEVKTFEYYKGIDFKYKNRYEQNKAIEELLNMKDDFSTDEKIFISQFSGYGGLDKFGAKGKGIMYEYFTPDEVIRKMWALAIKHGFNGGKVIEPSCGIGRFFKYAPDIAACTGIELNETNAKICRILYPEAEIQTSPFEKLFIKNNSSIKGKIYDMPKYALSVGNPPYGALNSMYIGMGEDKYTHANNWVEYFIRRNLDLLISGGLLIFVIGTEVRVGGTLFLEQGWTKCKKDIADMAELIDAYKLPAGIFEDTGVTTEIIVLRKK